MEKNVRLSTEINSSDSHIYYSATLAWNTRDMNRELLDWTWVRLWEFMTWLLQILEYLIHDTLTSLQLLVIWTDDWRWVILSNSHILCCSDEQCHLLRNCKMWVEKTQPYQYTSLKTSIWLQYKKKKKDIQPKNGFNNA